jgi:hypothetical protein
MIAWRIDPASGDAREFLDLSMTRVPSTMNITPSAAAARVIGMRNRQGTAVPP